MREDWRAWLPECKARLNDNCSKELETLYVMLSVSLNEALELRRSGSIGRSIDAARVAAGLCARFAQSMVQVLSGLHRHARHFGLVPNAAPLDPANFHGSRGQRTARLSGLLNRVLLSQRSRFIHKAATLQEMVEYLKSDFCAAVDDLVSRASLGTEELWDTLDQDHFDLNTCFRETNVLLKSFLLVLPEDQVPHFESALHLPHSTTNESGLAFRHRRFAAVPGK